jgi:parallel beta-helix repeat protein
MMSFTSISGNQINNQIVKPCKRGNILYVGGSGPGNYTKIQDAIENASDGDTVFVFDDSSPYYENINLWIVEASGISIIGEDKNTTIIDGCGADFVVDIQGFISYDMVFSDFTIKNGTYGIFLGRYNDNRLMQIKNNIITGNSNLGIWMDGVYGCTLSDNIIRENGGTGVWVRGDDFEGCGNNKIINNIIENNGGSGIDLTYTYDNTISNNIIKNNTREGIDCGSKEGLKSKNIITQNIITHNEDGIRLLDYSSDTIVSENIISNNENFGIYLLRNNINITIEDNIISHNNGSGIYIRDDVHNLSINHNIITDNNEAGIVMGESSHNKICKNNIAFHECGIFLWGANLIDIINNNIQNNEKEGLRLWDSKNNNISRNNFIKNKETNAFFYGTLFNCRNKWNSNYWGRPRLLPKIIFGRIGLYANIPWFQFDWHPAKQPYDITTTYGCDIV